MSMPPPPPFGAGPPPPPPGFQAYPAANDYGAPRYAGFGGRLVGNILDSLLYGLALSIFAIPAVVLGIASVDDCDRTTALDGTKTIECAQGQLKGGLLAAAIVLGLIGIVVVAVLYLRALGRTGQTWGRKLAGVKVVSKESGATIGFGRALGRTLFANVISQQICLLGYLWMLWDKDKQTWHDKVIGSIVVKA